MFIFATLQFKDDLIDYKGWFIKELTLQARKVIKFFAAPTQGVSITTDLPKMRLGKVRSSSPCPFISLLSVYVADHAAAAAEDHRC